MNGFYVWKLQKTEQMELYFKQLSDVTLEIEQNLTPEAYLARGVIHTGLANYEQAIADLHQALVQAPTNAIAYFTRGLAYASLKDYPSAVNDYSQVLTLSPDDAIARNNRGVAYAEMGDYQRALKDFVQGLSLNASPIEVGLHVNCGRCREVLGDHDGASNDFRTAMDLPEY